MKYSIFLLVLFTSFLNSQQINLIKEWKHEKELLGKLLYSVVDEQGDLMAFFDKEGLFLINDEKCSLISAFGEGPGEWSNVVRGICQYKNGVAMRELHGRVKLFIRNDSGYVFDKSIWVNSVSPAMLGKDLFYYNKRFIIIGMEMLKVEETDFRVNRLKVFEEESLKAQGSFINEQYKGPTSQYETTFFLVVDQKKLLAVKENDLLVYEIDLDNLKEERVVKLKIPEGYRRMPPDFYQFKQNQSNNQFVKNLEQWSTSYSAVTKAVIVKNKLVIQIRSFDQSDMKFAFLIYDIHNGYLLENIIKTNDILLGQHQNLLYCFKNGCPLLDDEADSLTISLFSFGEKQ